MTSGMCGSEASLNEASLQDARIGDAVNRHLVPGFNERSRWDQDVVPHLPSPISYLLSPISYLES